MAIGRTQEAGVRPTIAIVESIFDPAIRTINVLEQQIVHGEDGVDKLQWKQAEIVKALLAAGVPVTGCNLAQGRKNRPSRAMA